MPTKISTHPRFERKVKKLEERFPDIDDVLETLLIQLENDERPGDKIPNIGHDVYKSAPCQSICIKRQKWQVSGHLLCTTW